MSEDSRPPGRGDRKNCEACGERLIMAAASTGKLGPIALRPRAGGNVLLFRDHEGAVSYAVLAPGIAATLSSAGVPMRVNHFATCPQADRFRARREANQAGDDAPDAA